MKGAALPVRPTRVIKPAHTHGRLGAEETRRTAGGPRSPQQWQQMVPWVPTGLTCIILICFSDQESMDTDLTKEMCTPRPLCCPEHSRHMNTP